MADSEIDLETWDIVVRGHLTERWARRFEGMQIRPLGNGLTLLSGPLPDQAALFGVLLHIRDLGLTLVSVLPQNQSNLLNSTDGALS